jgi:hypothetical protein
MAPTGPHRSSRPATHETGNRQGGSGHPDAASQKQGNVAVVPPEDRRFVEKMRRRTTVRLNNPDAMDEARRAGTYVADRILQRTASSSLFASAVAGGGGRAAATAASTAAGTPHPAPPRSSGVISPSASSSSLFRASGGEGDSSQVFHSAALGAAPAPTSASFRRARAGSASSGTGAGGGGILDDRRSSYLLDGFPRGDNLILPTIPSFDLSVESSHDPRGRTTRSPGNQNSDDDEDDFDDKEDEGMMDLPAYGHDSSATATLRRRRNFSRQSSERAVRRGSRRGVREANERAAAEAALLLPPPPHAAGRVPALHDDEASAYSDFDLTTITDAFTDFTTKESDRRRRRERQQQQQQQVEAERSKVAKKKSGSKKWASSKGLIGKPKWLALGGGGKRGRKRSTSYSRSDAGGGDRPSFRANDDSDDDMDDDEDAWMCGVCGQVFPALEIAERHEDWHLRRVIQKLGWNAPDHADGTGPLDRGATSPPTHHSPDAAMQAAAEHANDTLHQLGYLHSGQDQSLMVPTTSAAGGRRLRFDSSDSIPNLRSNLGAGAGNHQTDFSRLSSGDRFYSVRHSHPDEEEKVEEGVVISTAGAGAGQQLSGPRRPAAVNNQNRLVSAGQYRSDLPEDTLIPTKRRPRTASGSEVRFEEFPVRNQIEPAATSPIPASTRLVDDAMPSLLMPGTMQNYVVLADEALLNVCWRATPLILAPNEVQAERHLAYLGKDKAYYDDIVARAQARRTNPSNRFRSDATDTLRGKVQNKLLDAYQLMKEGDANFARKDVYNRKQVEGGAAGENSMIHHSPSTMYVNVLVRNSVQVVKYELERLAREKWEHPDEGKEKYTRFELFRVYAHVNFVKLAGLALASDFTVRGGSTSQQRV